MILTFAAVFALILRLDIYSISIFVIPRKPTTILVKLRSFIPIDHRKVRIAKLIIGSRKGIHAFIPYLLWFHPFLTCLLFP